MVESGLKRKFASLVQFEQKENKRLSGFAIISVKKEHKCLVEQTNDFTKNLFLHKRMFLTENWTEQPKTGALKDCEMYFSKDKNIRVFLFPGRSRFKPTQHIQKLFKLRVI